MTDRKKTGAAIITGAAVRVGKEIAIFLAHHGYDIALHYNHSEKEAKQTAEEIRKIGVQCEIFQADLLKVDSYKTLIQDAHNTFNHLNILINSASIFEKYNFEFTDIDIFDRHFITNLRAPFFLSQEFAKICNKGCIINLNDTYITTNNGAYFAYLISKKSLHELTKMSAKALAPNIRVNEICIGSLLTSKYWGEEDIKNHVSKLPLQTAPTIDNITDTILYLTNSPYLTGQSIFIDSGQHITN